MGPPPLSHSVKNSGGICTRQLAAACGTPRPHEATGGTCWAPPQPRAAEQQSRGQKSLFSPKIHSGGLRSPASAGGVQQGPCTLRSCNLVRFLENEQNVFSAAPVGLERASAHCQLRQRGANIPITSCSAREGKSGPQVCHTGPILPNVSPVGPTPAPSLLLIPRLA